MAKYKIKVIAHLCKNNHVAKFGEEVDETQLTTNSADLVSAGFIELVDEDVKADGYSTSETESAEDLVEEAKKEVNNIKVTDAKNVKFDKKK